MADNEFLPTYLGYFFVSLSVSDITTMVCGVIGKVVNVTADESVMVDGKIDMSKVNAIAFDPYTHGYYKVTERVGEAFRDGLKLKK